MKFISEQRGRTFFCFALTRAAMTPEIAVKMTPARTNRAMTSSFVTSSGAGASSGAAVSATPSEAAGTWVKSKSECANPSGTRDEFGHRLHGGGGDDAIPAHGLARADVQGEAHHAAEQQQAEDDEATFGFPGIDGHTQIGALTFFKRPAHRVQAGGQDGRHQQEPRQRPGQHPEPVPGKQHQQQPQPCQQGPMAEAHTRNLTDVMPGTFQPGHGLQGAQQPDGREIGRAHV